mgnify:CR=1 FL=1
MNSTIIKITKKSFFLIVIVLIVLFSENLLVYASAVPKTDAESIVLLESFRGQILYKKNENNISHVAIANKIMLAVIVLENIELDSKITISTEAAEAKGSSLNLVVGNKYEAEDLLYAIMLTSVNDASIALAEYVGGDVKNAVKMMNDKATELNMSNTNFVNPTGLFDDNQYTTAHDLSILIKYALTNSTFKQIFSSKARLWTNMDETQVLINQNKLLYGENDYISGGKIGYNEISNQTAITSAVIHDFYIVAVVINSPKDSIYSDTENVLDYGLKNFKRSIILSKNKPIHSIIINNKEIKLISKSDIYYTHPIGEYYVNSVKFFIDEKTELPISSNKEIGIVRYTLSDDTTIDINLYPQTSIELPESIIETSMEKLKENKNIYTLVVIILFFEILLFLYHVIRLIIRFFKS